MDPNNKSVRLFSNRYLEALTRVPVWLPALVWLPVITFLIYNSAMSDPLSFFEYVKIAVLALLFWTLAEYFLHRVAFHAHFEHPILKRMIFLVHGVHHDFPNDAERLLMPPLAAVPIAFLFWLLFNFVLSASIAQAFFAFFLLGYLIYDYIHYATHHWILKSSLGKKIKRHHMLHHFANPHAYYGVSSPLWDKFFKSE